ncbi:MAG: lysophospholipid acyltransferase family protein [Longimicrobiales bacterium]
MTLYRAVQALARLLTRTITAGDFRMIGLENVPPSGPFILVANHQSFLDPIIIQGFCPRVLHSMAKSTQFASPLTGPLMKRLRAFPARRFQIDPQSVRIALRRLHQGEAVSIYIEGERSWDGRLQEPRLGTIRLILKAGVPVVPCAIAGSYHVLPRWDSRLRRHPIRVIFGPAFQLPQSDDRSVRERLVEPIGRQLMATIGTLLSAIEADLPRQPLPPATEPAPSAETR